MSGYTPSTDEVRNDYKLLAGDAADLAEAAAEFNRWIAEVQAAAWAAGAQAQWRFSQLPSLTSIPANPHSAAAG